jgi:hypothetical protein
MLYIPPTEYTSLNFTDLQTSSNYSSVQNQLTAFHNTDGVFVLTAAARTESLYKGKQSEPLQAWSGPEGSRKLRFSDFMKTAQDGGKVVSLMHRPPLPPGNNPGTHFC